MGSWRKVGAFLGLVPDEGRRDEFGDEYHDGDDYHPADGGADDYRSEYRTGDHPAGNYQDYDRGHESAYPPPRVAAYGDEPMTQGSMAMQPRADARRDPESAAAIRPVTVKLTGFSEARVIGEKFREGKPVILDMTDMDDAGARRLVDFAAGLAFALRGSIDKVTTKVFMLLPPDTDAADIPTYEPAAHASFTGGYETAGQRQAYAGARGSR